VVRPRVVASVVGIRRKFLERSSHRWNWLLHEFDIRTRVSGTLDACVYCEFVACIYIYIYVYIYIYHVCYDELVSEIYELE